MFIFNRFALASMFYRDHHATWIMFKINIPKKNYIQRLNLVSIQNVTKYTCKMFDIKVFILSFFTYNMCSWQLKHD